MKFLVIGGNRFFGKRLVSLLLERHHDVTVLNRGQVRDEFGDRIKRIKIDRRELRRDHPILGAERWNVIYDQVCFDASEAQAAIETFDGRVGNYIFTSTQSVYQDHAAADESGFDPFNYRFTNTVDRLQDYGEAKRQAEAVFFANCPFQVTAVRFPIVLGEDDYTHRLKFYVDRVVKESPIYLPNLNAQISFVHSADAAAFLLALADRAPVGPINCCAPEPITLERLVHLIEAGVGKTARLVQSESEADGSPFGISSDFVMKVQKLKDFGFSPSAIEDWLPSLIEHYRWQSRKTMI